MAKKAKELETLSEDQVSSDAEEMGSEVSVLVARAGLESKTAESGPTAAKGVTCDGRTYDSEVTACLGERLHPNVMEARIQTEGEWANWRYAEANMSV